MSRKSVLWIQQGYLKVAEEGFSNLNIESLARELDKSKSSFYHYFGDLEVFESGLLDFHIQQVEIFSEAIKACETIQPDVLNLFLEYKTDLFFHKQLRINRDKAEFKKCFEKAFSKVEEALLDKWTDYLGLGDQQLFATAFLRLIAENFLLQMSERNFGEKWLNNYLEEIASLLRQMNPGQ